jgi:branched-subunit amino acid ABC-type transport system permease component
MRVINLAHGSFYMYGAFLTSTIVGMSTGVRFWLALAVASLCVAVLGTVVEVGVVRWVLRRDPLTQLLSTFAVFLILADVGLRLWGSGFRTVPTPAGVAKPISIAGSVLPMYDAVIVGVAVLVGVGLWALLRHTVLGWRIRAAVDDSEMLEAGGVNLRYLYMGVFALGAFLAGLGGAIVTPQISVAPGIDSSIIVSAFLVAVIGGLGSVLGTAIGALIIGVADTVGTLVAPSWAATFMYVAVIIVLAVRPWGLLGTAER